MKLHPIIQELLESGLNVLLSYDKDKNQHKYEVSGFYKSGTVILTIESDTTLLATARYNEKTVINNLTDIVQLNYDWWLHSKERFSGWSHPDESWITLLTKQGLIKPIEN